MKSISDVRTDLSDMHASPKDFQYQLENNFDDLYNGFSKLSYSIMLELSTSGLTDCTSLIQEWIDAAAAVVRDVYYQNIAGVHWKHDTGMTLVLPFGQFPITNIKLRPGVFLKGVNPIASSLIITGPGIGIQKFDDPDLYSENNFGLMDLSVVSDGSASQTGIEFDTCTFGTLNNVIIRGFSDIGLSLKMHQYGNFSDVMVAENNVGIQLDQNADTYQCSDNQFINLRMFHNQIGLSILDAAATNVHNFTCQTNITNGVKIGTSSIGAHFTGTGHFEFHDSVYDFYNQGRATTLENVYFVISGTETERKIYTSSDLKMTNCYTQATTPTIIRGSTAMITIDGGKLFMVGGEWGATTYDVKDYAVDAADSVTAGADLLNVLHWHVNGFESRGSINLKNYSNMHDLIVSQIDGDSYSQFYINASGTLIWGSGAALGDTHLYRASGSLKTDNMFIANGGIGVGNALPATTLGSVTHKMEVFNASGVSRGFVPLYDSIT